MKMVMLMGKDDIYKVMSVICLFQQCSFLDSLNGSRGNISTFANYTHHVVFCVACYALEVMSCLYK